MFLNYLVSIFLRTSEYSFLFTCFGIILFVVNSPNLSFFVGDASQISISLLRICICLMI